MLSGVRVALVDVGKRSGSEEMMDRLEAHLQSLGAATERFRKEPVSQVSPDSMLDRIAAGNQMAVFGLADTGSSVSSCAYDLKHLRGKGVPGVALIYSHFAEVFRVQCDVTQFQGSAVEVSAADPDPFVEPLFKRTVEALVASGKTARP